MMKVKEETLIKGVLTVGKFLTLAALVWEAARGLNKNPVKEFVSAITKK